MTSARLPLMRIDRDDVLSSDCRWLCDGRRDIIDDWILSDARTDPRLKTVFVVIGIGVFVASSALAVLTVC